MVLLLRIWRLIEAWPWFQRRLLRLLNHSFLIGAVAVIFDDDERVVLFHHSYRRKWPWGLPGAWRQRGEDPPTALAREIREEADLEVEIVAPLATMTKSPSSNFEVVYLARLRGGSFAPSPEVDQAGHFTRDDLPPLQDYQRELVLAAFTAKDAGELPKSIWP